MPFFGNSTPTDGSLIPFSGSDGKQYFIVPNSSGVATSIVPDPPGAPATPTIIAGDSQVTITIAAPGNDGGSTVTGYVIVLSGSDSSSVTILETSAGSYTHTGLTNGVSYAAKVAAKNIIGQGSFSADSSAVTPASGPFAQINASGDYTKSPITNGGGISQFVLTSAATVTSLRFEYVAGQFDSSTHSTSILRVGVLLFGANPATDTLTDVGHANFVASAMPTSTTAGTPVTVTFSTPLSLNDTSTYGIYWVGDAVDSNGHTLVSGVVGNNTCVGTGPITPEGLRFPNASGLDPSTFASFNSINPGYALSADLFGSA